MADPTNPSIQQQQQVEALIDLANERLLMYPYKDVPSCWRSLLMDASLLQSFGLLTVMEQQEANITTTNELGRQVIKIVDTALVVSGCPGDKRRQLTLELLNTLQSWLRPPSSGTNHHRLLTLDATAPLPTLQHPIPILHQPPDYLWFEAHINQVPMATPLRLCGLMDHWPACSSRPWNDLDYLLQMTGDRIVPIEIGPNYTDPSWQQKMVRMEDFIHNYILSPSTTAYLAQHNLFDHIPLLANDISIPEYCYVDPKPSQWYSSEPPDVIQHAWFGPKGTVSPLHQDPYHNLLAQVVGRKYIRLYAPTLSQALYPFDGMMSNTSQVTHTHTLEGRSSGLTWLL
jgi:lysine-specific demethylase 8